MSGSRVVSLVECSLERGSRRGRSARVDPLHRVEPAARVRLAARSVRELHGVSDLARLARLRDTKVSAATIGSLSQDLALIDESALCADDRLVLIAAADRISAWHQARAAAVLGSYVGPRSEDVDVERHLRLEVRISRGISDAAAGNDIASARALAGPCAPVRELWAAGVIGYRHVAAVVDRTLGLPDDLTALVVAEIVDRLPRTPATRVRGLVTRTVARLAPRAAVERARAARRHDVGVAYRSLPDGLGQVIATLPVEAARAVVEATDSAADAFLTHQRSCAPCVQAVPDEIGLARAHVFLHALGVDHRGNPLPDAAGTGTGRGDSDGQAADPTIDTTVTETSVSAAATAPGKQGRAGRRRGELQVVLDLATLLGLAEHPGLLNGQPVPAGIARELVPDCGSLRRIVTDPATGHLLDYGTRTYLPAALRDFVIARDGTCRAPGCGQPAARSQLDHVIPFPHGPSNPANTHMYCLRDHASKTAGDITITSHLADGTTTWRTRHGQEGTTPPRPYLNDPTDDIPPY